MMIPFKAQIERPGRRRCGAATLVMVYRSFGLEIDSAEIIAELDAYEPNLNRARSFHLSRNACEHGLSAFPCRLREPWDALLHLSDQKDLRIILNHRIRPDSPLGHYTVLVGINDERKTLCVHDPQLGPNRELAKSEFLALWEPLGEHCEITGRIAVLVSTNGEENEKCAKCGKPFSSEPLQKLPVHRLQTVFCPWCDAVHKIDLGRKADFC